MELINFELKNLASRWVEVKCAVLSILIEMTFLINNKYSRPQAGKEFSRARKLSDLRSCKTWRRIQGESKDDR